MEAGRPCGALTLKGGPCKIRVCGNQAHCHLHIGPQCSVCFNSMNTTASRTLDCGHIFHQRCVERWKRTCPGDPTCPMCRVPFDVPIYRCRLIIERVADNYRSTTQFESSNVLNIVQGFGLDFRNLMPNYNTGRMFTDIHFDIEPQEVLADILRELGLPLPSDLQENQY